MEPRSVAFHNAQLNDLPLLPQVILRLPMGDRAYGFVSPETNASIGTNPVGASFESGDFTAVPVLAREARLLDLSPIEESIQPLDPDVLGSWGQNARPTLQFSLDNGDKAFSTIVGQEYVLNQSAFLFVGLPGLGWDQSMLRFSGNVQRFTLSKRAIRIEAETLC